MKKSIKDILNSFGGAYAMKHHLIKGATVYYDGESLVVLSKKNGNFFLDSPAVGCLNDLQGCNKGFNVRAPQIAKILAKMGAVSDKEADKFIEDQANSDRLNSRRFKEKRLQEMAEQLGYNLSKKD